MSESQKNRVFVDLAAEIENLPEIGIVAVGAIPIILDKENQPTLFGNPATVESVKSSLLASVGLGSVLTYKNPKRKSLSELGAMCYKLDHLWTEHSITLTIAFSNCPIAVRNAFAFDRQFHLSWVESEVNPDVVTYTASGSLKAWRKMAKRKDDSSFKRIQREWFQKVSNLLETVLPDVES